MIRGMREFDFGGSTQWSTIWKNLQKNGKRFR